MPYHIIMIRKFLIIGGSMAKLSNAIIERIAVQAIRNAVNTEPYMLRAEIPEGDKGISFDGKIEVFTDTSEKTESYYGSVPVQVKGTTVNTFSGQQRKFQVSKSHLKNYYKNSGVIFFVVEIDQNRQEKIYYKQLLPLDLSDMIRRCNSKKSESTQIELRSIDNTNIDRVCRLFLKEKDLQPLSLIENKHLLDEYFKTLTMRSLTIQPNLSNLHEMFNHDFFVYGVINELHVPIEIARITSLSRDSTITIEINNVPHTYDINADLNQDSFIITVEQVLQMNFAKSKLKVTLLDFHSLSSQLKIIPILLGFIEKKSIKILNNEVSLNRTEEDPSNFYVGMKQHILFIRELEQAFLFFKINKEIEFKETRTGLSLIKGLDLLIRASKHEDFSRIDLKLPTGDGFINLVIGDKTILLFLRNNNFIYPFNEELAQAFAILSYQKEDECYHSIYSLLTIESLISGVNIDFNTIQSSFDKFDPYCNESAYNTTIDFCLKCISAYDQSTKKELLYLADNILSKYRVSAKIDNLDNETVIIYVNRLQISKRLHNSLTDNESDILINIKNSFDSNEFADIHFCTNILLESKVEAKRAYDRLDVESKKKYETMPIMKLYKDLIKEIHAT